MKLKNKYSIKFKLKCLDLIKILGIYRTALILKINRKCIRNWYKNRQKLYDIEEKISTYRLPGGGNKIKNPKKEAEMVLFMNRCKEIGIILNTKLIVQEYCRICPDMKKYSKSSLKNWCYRFLKRNNFFIYNFEIHKK